MKPYYYVQRVGHSAAVARHSTPTLAAKEAERLAAKHPGDTFEVLQCVAVTRCAQPSTFWMDGHSPSQETFDPGEGYRLLEIGEQVEPGDEWLVEPNGWRATSASARVKIIVTERNRYRRRIAPRTFQPGDHVRVKSLEATLTAFSWVPGILLVGDEGMIVTVDTYDVTIANKRSVIHSYHRDDLELICAGTK
jgi:hypothetical protein